MKPKSNQKKIESVLNTFPFVLWDRFVSSKEWTAVYGWIKRDKDKYKDFLLITFWKDGTIQYDTSSSKYSLEIYQILNGGKKKGHATCKRVENYFNVKNAIKIKAKKK